MSCRVKFDYSNPDTDKLQQTTKFAVFHGFNFEKHVRNVNNKLKQKYNYITHSLAFNILSQIKYDSNLEHLNYLHELSSVY